MKTDILTMRKQYEFNPHRHVKIWLSKNPDVFMNELNQLRLIQMRAYCPNDEINLIYDSQLLSETAHRSLQAFCSKEDINIVDVRSIISQCNQPSEQQLIKIYEDEITHLDAGGNLAAASDILRWLEPIYRLGTYSDFDVRIVTKDLPETIPVFSELLLNSGSVVLKDKYGSETQNKLASNDIIAVLNPQSKRIKKIHQDIISACAPQRSAPRRIGYLPPELRSEKAEQYNHYLTKLRSLYLEKTPREWRSNIPGFIQCLNELIKHGGQIRDLYEESSISSEHIERLTDYYSNGKLQHELYKDSVIESTGPNCMKSLFQQGNNKEQQYFTAAYSLSSYKQIFRAFYSSQALFLRMSKSYYDNRRECDLSWLEEGQLHIAELEKKLRLISAQGKRVEASDLHLEIKDKELDSLARNGHIGLISTLMERRVCEPGSDTMHELHQPLTAYFEIPPGTAVFNNLVENANIERLLTPFLDGEYFTQEADYVKELARIMLEKINRDIEKYTSAQVMDMNFILKPYAVCYDLDMLISYQKRIRTRGIHSIRHCLTESLDIRDDLVLTSNNIIEYYKQNKNIVIDSIDSYFNELEHLPNEALIAKITQLDMSVTIVVRGNIYALNRYFEILKKLSSDELGAVLTHENKNKKTISYYLLESRHDMSELIEVYILKMYINLLQQVKPQVRSMILGFESQTGYMLSSRFMYKSHNHAEVLCAYFVLLGNDKSVTQYEYIEELQRQLLFEYILNRPNSPEKNKLIDLALSTDSALNAFITHMVYDHLFYFVTYPSFQSFHPYIWALSELKRPVEQQSNALFAATMRFFIPTPLNATKLDQSKFNHAM